MKKLLLVIPVVLITVSLAGCSVGALPGGDPAAGAATAAPSTAADQKAPPTAEAVAAPSPELVDPCKVVTVAMMDSLTGRPYRTATRIHNSEYIGCTYDGADPKTLQFGLAWYGGGSATFTKMVKYSGESFTTTSIPGVGDEATYVTRALIVRYGNDNFIALDGIAPPDYGYINADVSEKLIATLEAAR